MTEPGPPPAAAAGRLVVHLALRPQRFAAGPRGPDVHVQALMRRRPSALDGADLVVAHGRVALLVALTRTRAQPVPIAYRGTDPDAAIPWRRWSNPRPVRRAVDDDDLPPAPPVPPDATPPSSPATGAIRIRPAATRRLGDRLLVARPDPHQAVEEVGGSGPSSYALLAAGLGVGEVVERVVAETGSPAPVVAAAIQQFTVALFEAGLAEPS